MIRRVELDDRHNKPLKEKEKMDWVNKHGSDYLRRAVNLGYNCQRQYVTERALSEFPDFILDFDNRADWKTRSCPSIMALDEVEEFIRQGYDAKVVWLIRLTRKPPGKDCPLRRSLPAEAVVITGYLGKYNLIKLIPRQVAGAR